MVYPVKIAAAVAVGAGAALTLCRCALRRRAAVHPAERSGVVVTGVSTGIGAAAAEALLRKGYVVYGTVRREADAAALRAAHPERFVALLVDVTCAEDVQAAAAAVKADAAARGIALAAVVNNAGASGAQVVEAVDIDAAKWIFDVNYFGVMRVTQAFLPLLREARGRVVIVGSLAGVITRPCSAVYSGSKYAVEALADALRREVLGFGMAVSLIQPGVVSSGMAARAHAVVPQMVAELAAQGLDTTYRLLVERKEASARNYAPDAIAAPDASTTPAILHAVASPYPRTRYQVAGFGAIPGAAIPWLAALLPDTVADAVLLRL
eukprot:TRINITY_DN7072_c0_g1_i1.p1 TRINITY_DN7072_c0_g1~~TRINITY_DN7072_c0_g1_i1.p1  ORF type:complete len:323 (+),score=87.85 TRINITY_DN7072_c0_g1_i1:44-1012(+)